MMASLKENLDFTSETFDPLLALETPDVAVPQENARIFNNLSEYTRHVNCPTESSVKPSNEKKNRKTLIEQRRERLAAMVVHKSEPKNPEAEMRSQPKLKTIFSFMEGISEKGPLSLLYRCIQEKIRIKVWTRNYKHVRGICTGYLIVFDKHWNMALTDVDETFIHQRTKKVPYLAKVTTNSTTDDKLLAPSAHLMDEFYEDDDNNGKKSKSVEKLKCVSETCSESRKGDIPSKSLSNLTELNIRDTDSQVQEHTLETSDKCAAKETVGLGTWMPIANEDEKEKPILTCIKCKKLKCTCPVSYRLSERCHVPSECTTASCKIQTYQRHVNQLFIRGENIVLVSLES